ncbi:MAG: 3-phosphoshikimate 1-carboxyvinyltransferase [Planctomycetota bacterium]|nr:3-phosphoshikimate 1-carboxyvinyltransferase [Planctomycetota bacterium]
MSGAGGSEGEMLAALRGPLEALPDPLPLPCAHGRSVAVDIRPPGSKSLTNRAVLLAALAEGHSEIRGVLDGAEDSEVMLACVRALGATVERTPGAVRVRGVGGRWPVPPGGVTLDCRNAGTAARFLAAAALRASGPVTIDGSPRMRERPIGELGEALGALGCGVEYLGTPGRPPVRITPPHAGAPVPDPLTLGPTQSSQFVSAILLMAPWLGGLTVRLTGVVTSPAYITMTLGLLARLGATARTSDDLRLIRVFSEHAGLGAFSYDVEPDASGGTYWWGAGALLAGGAVGVEGLDTSSLQGDAEFPDVLARMGARVDRVGRCVRVCGPARLEPVTADCSAMPDAAMTLGAVACFAGGTSLLRGLRTLRVKESDRHEAMCREFAKLGVRVEAPPGEPDAMRITPPARMREDAVEFDTYDDHRMAMSLALVALRRPGVHIRNPGCVRKTYPGFWADFARLYDPGQSEPHP